MKCDLCQHELEISPNLCEECGAAIQRLLVIQDRITAQRIAREKYQREAYAA